MRTGGKTMLLLAAVAYAASLGAAGRWRATALDPQTVVLQGEYSEAEHAAFAMSDADNRLTPAWRYDAAFRRAAEKAQAGRPEREAKLKAGPYLATGAEVAAFSYWKYPLGASRFPDRNGRAKGVPRAELMNIVYLRLSAPLRAGAKVRWQLPTGEQLDWQYAPESMPTPLIKVNQVGYAPDQGRKFAYLGGWLGPEMGAYRPSEHLVFELIDVRSGRVVKKGPVVFRAEDCERDGNAFAGERTGELDFSEVTAEGRYCLRVPGVGRSLEFAISPSALGAAFAVHMQGLFHQRCGCAKPKELTRWTDAPCHLEVFRGVHPPNEWECGCCFTDSDGKPRKLKHFAVITAMTRDCTERLSLPGGWHDAADYDRRPMHLEIVNSLLMAYLLRPANFTDSQLAVPERGNGIPDILDEALWGLRHLRAAQQPDGGVGTWIEACRHPAPNDGKVASADDLAYYLSRATRGSSIDYAGHAALLARAFVRVGTPAAKRIADDYRRSAIAAWQYGQRPVPGPVRMRCGWKEQDEIEVCYQEPAELDVNGVVKAAVNLYALTRDADYLGVLKPLADRFRHTAAKNGWRMAPERHAEFLFTEVDDPGYRQMQECWNLRIVAEADRMLAETEGPGSWPYRRPWHSVKDWRVSHLSWGNSHPLRRAKTFCYAHALTGERKYLDAAYLANDYHNGCNPRGMTWTSGLGVAYPVSFLSIDSVCDGIAEYVPGITPYRQTYGMDGKLRELVWGDAPEAARWPYFRQYANMEEYTVAVSEYTVWETMGPAAFTTGYLMTPGAQVPLANREPAKDVRDLAGYWTLP
ncbi:MAG: glycoside hydrolase family 9 protein [Kiritimatiellia bacterium]